MKHILAMLLALLGASGALAQIYVKVVPEKKTFLSGEAMYMRLTITNNSGVPVELKSREYSSWLDIHVEHSTAGAELPQSKFALFPPLKVPAGMSVSRKIDLRHFYDLSREGNYHVQAVVKMPNQKDMFASQKSLFAVRTGTPMWSQTVDSGQCQAVHFFYLHYCRAGNPEIVCADEGSGYGSGLQCRVHR